MKKILATLLTAAMVTSLLAGCGSSAGNGTSSNQSAEETVTEQEEAEAPAEEAAEAPAEAEAPADAAAGDQAEAPAEAPADAAADTTAVAGVAEAAADGELQTLAVPGFNIGGGLKEPEEMEEPDEMSQEETDKLDRAMRAYTPPEDSLLQNKAENFYYYSQMNNTEKAIYDALLMCATDPTNTDNAVVATIDVDPTTREFAELEFTAYYGMLYDHPELFGFTTDQSVT